MRAGVAVSLIGHVGAVLMTMLAWEANSRLPDDIPVVVPIDIVDVAEEANVRALAEDIPDEEETAAEETEATDEPQPAPTPAPTPPQRRQQANDEFDLAEASRMVNRAQDAQRRRQEGERADRNQRSAGLGTAEVASLEARIAAIASQELNRCWRSVADLPDPERLVVVVAIRLNRDGSLNGQPRVVTPANYTFDPLMNEAVNRALRAVRTCDPIERLPQDPIVGEHFNLWRDQEVRFGLRQ
jgi:hypothetical protein